MADDDQTRVTPESLAAAGLRGWSITRAGLQVAYDCGSFTAAGEFAGVVAALADERNHHPDLAIAYPGHLTLTVMSHDVGRLTDRDLGLATAVGELARTRGYDPVEGE